MTSWGTLYWRVFNVLVRALGLVAFLSGIVFTVWGAVRMLRMDFIRMEDAPTTTYRPDLGDVPWGFDPFGAKSRQSSPAKRSWWTGDP